MQYFDIKYALVKRERYKKVKHFYVPAMKCFSKFLAEGKALNNWGGGYTCSITSKLETGRNGTENMLPSRTQYLEQPVELIGENRI